MWTYNDESRVISDMESRRACPSYEARFDICDPLGSADSVLDWSNREPARIIRRRCRSEGIDRSPFEDACRAGRDHPSPDSHLIHQRVLSSRGHYTLNADYYDFFRQNSSPPNATQNGDYLMSHEQDRYHRLASCFVIICKYYKLRRFLKQNPFNEFLDNNACMHGIIFYLRCMF